MNQIVNDTRVFKVDPDIDVKDVRFTNRYGITLAGHFYFPKGYSLSWSSNLWSIWRC